jgi:superfamily II DNA/RNA helicase
MNDVIDNRNEKLIDHINKILDSTERAKFAVGYFFVSGLTAIREHLESIKELRLLIGNTTNRETLEQISEGYRRLELVEQAAEAMNYPKRTEIRQIRDNTASNLRGAMELVDQTDEAQEVLNLLARLIQEKRLKVRVYTKGRLHAKAYIFDYKQDGRYEKGIGIVGSSNFTLSGVIHNTELNVVVRGDGNHAELSRWFDELWADAQDFDEILMQEIRQSWAAELARPYEIYMKTLYTLVEDRLEGEEAREVLWDDEIRRKLTNFQEGVVLQAVQMIQDYGGCFISDVVGLGKSFIGAAILKYLERRQGVRPLIICPKSLEEMWAGTRGYNETYALNAAVVPMSLFREDDIGTYNYLLDNYPNRDFVLVDESHNFRHSDTQRYRVLQTFLATGRKCVFLTATPRNKSIWDVYNQIKLFHQDDTTDLPVYPSNLRQYFRSIESGKRKLPDLLRHVLIRRTREHILKWYGYDAETDEKIDPSRFQEYKDGSRRGYVLVGDRRQFFPRRELETIEYSIEATYQGLYQKIRRCLGRPERSKDSATRKDELTYARYGLWHYVRPDKQKASPYDRLERAGANLRGIMRIMLFKRFESSVYAFRETLKRLFRIHNAFLESLERGIVPAGDKAQDILYESDQMEEADLFDALREATGTYNINDLSIETLKRDISQDIGLLNSMLEMVKPITPENDAKLRVLMQRLDEDPLSEGKRLIFTQYADTARYLYDNLDPGHERDDIEVIFSGDKSKSRVVGRFAPKANPELAAKPEIKTLVSTDVLSEGLNLQDCDKVINYDLHWNPVRLIQRFGRIDRIGSEYDFIYAFNFLPETELERNLGLQEKLANRIQEIHDTIGEDAAILDETEQINEEAMYAIYEKKGQQLNLFVPDEDFLDLNEAEQKLRQLRDENPEEFERIANLRDGIRSSYSTDTKGLYVFCQAGRYQQLFLVNSKGKIESRDIDNILGVIQCGPALPAGKLPEGYNEAVMKIKSQFAEEVKRRMAERDYTRSLTSGQKYILRELRIAFGATEDEDKRKQISVLEQAFRSFVTVAINRELNLLRRNGVSGEPLINNLIRIYNQHNMEQMSSRSRDERMGDEIPRIICSEALI